ncbi:MAG: hydantoinase B/oxoprolinase family protein, partial [Thermoplasmata archaeon]
MKLEIMKNAFSFVPQEMGTVLRRAAYSPNVKERMDASCAVFDAEGRMFSQAEHIPVHLGSMPMAVGYVKQYFEDNLKEGDQIVVNDPYHGGSHLNDITLVRPVFLQDDLVGYTVNKAHHADVGGRTPGSMPAGSRRLDEEGFALEPTKLMEEGAECTDIFEFIRNNTRTPTERLGDLRAQIAANNTGSKRLNTFLEKYGRAEYNEFVEAVLAYSELRVRKALRNIPNGTYTAEDLMDDDGCQDRPVKIAVSVSVAEKEVKIDFTGT